MLRESSVHGGGKLRGSPRAPLPLFVIEDDRAEEPDEREPVSGYTEEEREKIAAYFHTSTVTHDEEDRFCLQYDFESEDHALCDDFLPRLQDTKNRIRWARGYEGTYSTVEEGIVIADSGIWLHQAQWLPDVEIDVDFLSMSSVSKGDLIAAVYAFDRGKKVLGSQLGRQCVYLRGYRHAKRPIPAQESPVARSEDRIRFGFQLADNVFACVRSGSRTYDTREVPAYTKNLEPGMVGLTWNGTVQGFVFRITIKGKLDPEWVEEKIGVAAPKPNVAQG